MGCFNEKNAKEEKKKQDSKEEEAKAKAEQEAKPQEADVEAAPKAEQKEKTRCWICNKKIPLAAVMCKCGYYFCNNHRYAEEHDCTYDHKGKGREVLAKQNPSISDKKRQE